MRYIKRLKKPDNLEKKEKEWTDKFIVSGKDRPDSSKYAHRKIRDILLAMSHSKCFYCEQKLKGRRKEVDHYIEVVERKDLAFNWENLYLTCDHCNGKIPNKSISAIETLNPCGDLDEVIQKHLGFEDEIILAKNNSTKGNKTIQKYRLSAERLDLLRAKELQKFSNVLIHILKQQIIEGRESMTEAEINLLKRFAQNDHSFSLMFKTLLEKYDIK
ncbi:MAG: HNH endonuclease [Chitinophagales bacterium]